MRTARLAALAAAAVALCGCKSSAKYTVPAAALNTGLAAGLSVLTRSQGGCYAVCAHGTVCNPKTGYCETEKPGQFCEEAPGGGVRCAMLAVDLGGSSLRPLPPPAGRTPALPMGISPATGSAPPPPAESSPRSGP